MFIGDHCSMGDVCGVTSWGVNCGCTGELLVGIPWLVVLPSGCTGACESVGAVGVSCPHGNELHGEVSWLCCV